MSGVLQGLKVVEMGSRISIPAAGAMMSDWGADVIKVEPVTGETMRGQRNASRSRIAGVNVQFELLNRGKRGLALDLKKDAGVSVVHRLVRESDVFIANYDASALRNLRLDYSTLSRLNSRLIYAVITGYGSKGPDSTQPGYDFAAGWARSGAQALMTEPGGIPPTQRSGICSSTAGVHAVAGICAALYARQSTGEGQEMEVSLYHVGVYSIACDVQDVLNGIPVYPNDRRRARNPLSNCYLAEDGRWFELAMIQPERYWHSLCQDLDRPDLENDPRFESTQQREQNAKSLIDILDAIFAEKKSAEWERRFRESGVVYALIETPDGVVNDRQAHANGFFSEIAHPRAQRMKYVTAPVQFGKTPATVRTAAPEVGQHGNEILLSLGYTQEEISAMKQNGVIA